MISIAALSATEFQVSRWADRIRVDAMRKADVRRWTTGERNDLDDLTASAREEIACSQLKTQTR